MRLQDLFEEQSLLEVNMSPSALRLAASKINARAGMEFEIIVSGADTGDSDDAEYEPDYDYDETPESIDHIVRFFDNSDFVYNDTSRMESKLHEQYGDWQLEKCDEDWANNEEYHVYQWVLNMVDDADILEALELDPDTEMNKEIRMKYVELCIEDQNSVYEDAKNDHMDEFMGEDKESEWLDETYNSMMDIQNEFDMSWPYVLQLGNGVDSIADVAEEFGYMIGKPTEWNESYHGGRRKPNTYTVEPDSSLDADDQRDGGLEFISPPQSLSETLDDLRKVVAWCKERGNYTNDSTGLHMNISVPGYSIDKLDYVKLALFLGDEYVLKAFGRESNTYCKSALQKIRQRIRPEDREAVLAKMSQELSSSASKIIHSGITDKYTSINTKSDYIEFRSPGGDWLSEDIEKLESTLLRFVVALNIAIDPSAYKQEYAKKLYKLLSPADDGSNIVTLFSNYKSGKIERAELIQQLKSAQLQRKIQKGSVGGQQYWWRVEKEGRNAPNGAVIEVVAGSKEVALQVAAEEWNTTVERLTRAYVTPLRPYSTSPVKAKIGEPQVAGRPSNPDGTWILSPEGQNPPVPLFRFNASGVDDANNVVDQWNRENPNRPAVIHYDARQFYGQPRSNNSGSNNRLSQTDIENRLGWGGQADDANYEIIDRSNNQSVFKFIANTEQEAQRKYNQVLDVFGLPHNTENYTYRTIRQQTVSNLTPRGPGPWELYRLEDNWRVTPLRSTSREDARREAEGEVQRRVLTPELYGVRTLQSPRA